MRRTSGYSRILNKKKELGNIPEDTCPDIDKIISILEELRIDNAKLRSLGREWYELADEMADEVDKIQDEMEEMEKERDELYTENESLKREVNALA